MTIPEPYFSADFWAGQGWMAPWLDDVHPAYWREMTPAICENMIRRKAGWRDFILTPEGQQKLRVQLCTRLSQASESFVPWLEQSRPLDAQFREVAPDWLEGEVDEGAFSGPYDLVCYAMLEHLLIPERIQILSLAKRIMQRDGAMPATFETPNRFAPFDWHSSKLVFTDVLPDDLAFAFARARSAREAHPSKRYETFTAEAQKNLYRGGRGLSWHEFDLVFGMEAIAVVLDGYSPRSVDQKTYKPDQAYEEALDLLIDLTALVRHTLSTPQPGGRREA